MTIGMNLMTQESRPLTKVRFLINRLEGKKYGPQAIIQTTAIRVKRCVMPTYYCMRESILGSHLKTNN